MENGEYMGVKGNLHLRERWRREVKCKYKCSTLLCIDDVHNTFWKLPDGKATSNSRYVVRKPTKHKQISPTIQQLLLLPEWR
jgi:hypothetical protein